eukprot:7727714-Alexandrium_andersonii.AAC.1
MDIDEAMDTILTMENEFEVYLHAHYPNLWQYTLLKAYDKVVKERVEISFSLLGSDAHLQNEKVAASMVRDLR